MIEDQHGNPRGTGSGEPLPAMRKFLAGAVADPAPGQVWRGRWDETAAVGVLLEVHTPWMIIAPIGDNPDYADDQAVVVRDLSALGFEFTVWPHLAVRVPMAALDIHLGDLPQAMVARPGSPRDEPASAIDQQARYQLAIQERWWLIAERAAPVVPQAAEQQPSARDRLEAAGNSFDDLVIAVGVHDGLAIWRGDRAPTDAEAARIEAATGMPPAPSPRR